jgi:acyl-CoA thioesterase FadM
VVRLGGASIELAIDAFVSERPCFRSRHTVCTFSSETLRAVPIPDDLRARMLEYLDESYVQAR